MTTARGRKSTTALLRRIDAEAAAKAQAERDRRLAEARSGVRERKLPRWAVDHLMASGEITADQHEAAIRYASAVERCHIGAARSLGRVDGGGGDLHALLWDASVAASVVRTARVWVSASKTTYRKRMDVLDKLFAFDGKQITGPRPTMIRMQETANGKMPYRQAVDRIRNVLDLLMYYFEAMDRSLEQSALTTRNKSEHDAGDGGAAKTRSIR